MKNTFLKILLIATVCFIPTLALPDLLKQQRHEFQEFHSSSSHDQSTSFSENAQFEVAPVSVQHEPIPWSQQHPNEVIAFAEMFRQNYNQMIEQHNKMLQIRHHALANAFMPVTYELYHVPDAVMWENYFGTQQQYVHDQTEQMSRQLIHNLEQGRVSSQDLMNPNFFIAQAAYELNRVNQVRNDFETNDNQIASSDFGDTYQQHQYDAFDALQQQQHQIFVESAHDQETEGTDQILVYNHKTREYQYVTVVAASEVTSHGKQIDAMSSNTNVQHPSYIQSPPPVEFQNEMLHKFSHEEEKTEVRTPVSAEAPRLAQQQFNAGVKVSTYKPLETTYDEYYGSTYDQQPINDLRFVKSVSSTSKPSMVNVMSLVRNKTKVKISTSTSETSTTTSTTTELPTTKSNIMSMLPNKKPVLNYTEIYQKVRTEIDKQLKQISDNKSDETHFMGMTSNIDHVKLSYETIVDKNDHKESRGDQPSRTEDYISEEFVESEPGMGYYSVNTEPELLIPTTSVKSSSTPSSITSTAKPIRAYQNPFYTARLAPFPVTTKSPNPYYSASLAPFPGDILQVPQITAQSQIEHFELSDMSQETQVIDHPNGSPFIVVDTIQEFNEQQYDDVILENSEFQMSHDMQQYENVQQRYFDIAGGHNMEGQRYEKQLPPEQSYRNPDLQHSVAGFDRNSDIPAHVKEITETPAPVGNKTQKNNWFQRQFSKLKNVF